MLSSVNWLRTVNWLTRVLGFAWGNVHYQLCEVVRVARTFGHKPHAATSRRFPSSPVKFKLRHYPPIESVST